MGLPEAAEHVQKGIPHPVTAGGLLHGDVVDVALVQHHLETGVAQHAALPVLGDNEAGLGVKERVREHVLAPGRGEALPLQRRDLGDMAPVHGDDDVFHRVLLFSRCDG